MTGSIFNEDNLNTISNSNKKNLMDQNVKTGVIITTHGFNGVYARQCLESFIRELPPNYFIVLYINESQDPITLELQDSHGSHYVDIVYVENQQEGGGLTGTWNKGIDKCLQENCDVIIVSNDDVVFDGCINNIIWQCYLEKDALKYFGPISNNPGPIGNKGNQCQYGMFPEKRKCYLAKYKGKLWNINGFFMVFSKYVLLKNKFNKTYYFDPKKPFSGNEVEWFNRFKAIGGKSVIVPQTFIYHYKLSTWRNNKLNDLCIYTVNTGLYDGMNLYLQKQLTDTLYYTDSFRLMYKCMQKGLIPFYVDTHYKETRLVQRLIKTNPSAYIPHHYTMSIYVDANVGLNIPVDRSYTTMMNLVDELKKDDTLDLICFAHPCRIKAAEEAACISVHKLESTEKLFKLLNEFHIHEFPNANGFTETNCLIRKHEPLQEFHKEWNNYVTMCNRDQISFELLLFKNKINYKRLAYNIKSSFICSMRSHKPTHPEHKKGDAKFIPLSK